MLELSLAQSYSTSQSWSPDPAPKSGSVLDTSPLLFCRGLRKMDLLTGAVKALDRQGNALGAQILDLC